MAAYVTIQEADDYFAERLYTDAWDQAGDATKQKALAQATRVIDRLTLVGYKKDTTQELQFPRCYFSSYHGHYCQDTVPQEVKDATCEEALALLEHGQDKRLKLQRQGVESFSVGNLSETYRAGSGAGLISQEAREFMRPFTARAVKIV